MYQQKDKEMKPITRKDFNQLLAMAEIRRTSFDTLKMDATDENPSFYFTYDIRDREIVNAGMDYTPDQRDALLYAFEDYVEENTIDLIEEEDIYDPYNEFGINPEMFI